MRKTKSLRAKAQSALEYMMTYGWAILIVVLVAGAIYSLGIFNPGSAITGQTLINGFSGVHITAANANSTAFETTVSNQLGYTIQIKNFSLISNGVTIFKSANCTGVTLIPSQNTICYITGDFGSGVISVIGSINYKIIGSSINQSSSSSGTIRLQSQTGSVLPAPVPGCMTYTLFSNTSISSPLNLTYSVGAANSFVAIMIGSGSASVSNVILPAGCSKVRYLNSSFSYDSYYSAICDSQSTGSYIVQMLNPEFANIAIAAYVFSPGGCNYAVNNISTLNTPISVGLPYGFSEYLCSGGTSGSAFDSFSGTVDSNATIAAVSHQSADKCDYTTGSNYLSLGVLGLTSAKLYNITFTETGLPSNKAWNVTLNGSATVVASSPNPVIFTSPSGNYSYSIPSVRGILVNGCGPLYEPSLASGYAKNGSTVSVTFANVTVCTTTFSESSLPSGATWNITYNGTYKSSTSTSMSFNTNFQGLLNFTAYRIPSGNCYYAPHNGSLGPIVYSGKVKAGKTFTLTYKLAYCLTTFNEQGLPNGNPWNASFDGRLGTGSTSNIVFNTSTKVIATFGVNSTLVGSTEYCPVPLFGRDTAGSQVNITFSSSSCLTVFEETGLPFHTFWNMTYDGILKNSTYGLGNNGQYVNFTTPAGNFSYAGYSFQVTYGGLTCRYSARNVNDSNGQHSVHSGQTGTVFTGYKYYVKFSLISCVTQFTVTSGLPSGYSWNVTYDGITKTTTGSTITFNTTSGYYNGYIPKQYNGSATGCEETTAFYPQFNNGALSAGTNNTFTFTGATNCRMIYVTQSSADTLAVIDSKTNTLVANVSGFIGPDSVAVRPDGQYAYVTNTYNSSVSIFNTNTNAISGKIYIAKTVGTGPEGISITPNGQYAYIANEGENPGSVSVINLNTNTVLKNITTAGSPGAVFITPNGQLVYVVSGSAEITVINTSTNIDIQNISGSLLGASPDPICVDPAGDTGYVGFSAQGGPGGVAFTIPGGSLYDPGFGTSENVYGLLVSPTGKYLFDNQYYTSGQTAIINIAGFSAAGYVHYGSGYPEGEAYSPYGDLYVADAVLNEVHVINMTSFQSVINITGIIGPVAVSSSNNNGQP